jgi:hypothetical protein
MHITLHEHISVERQHLMLNMTTYRRKWKGNPGQYTLADSRLAQLPASERQDEIQERSLGTASPGAQEYKAYEALMCGEKVSENRERFRQFATLL